MVMIISKNSAVKKRKKKKEDQMEVFFLFLFVCFNGEYTKLFIHKRKGNQGKGKR